ncbi:MAG TPA: Flp pilus assembly protein CpaB [Actinomycetota bacterium]|jgi:pilus assembly protein CpaB
MGRKWSFASKVWTALAIVLGAAAFLTVHGYTQRVEALAPAMGSPEAMLVASRDLARGTRLADDMFRRVTVPSRFVPPGVMRDARSAVGRVLLAGLAEGEALTVTRLAPARAGPIAALVPEGFRAVSLPVELPAGSVHSNDRVDVLATYTSGRHHVETVATALEVLLVLDSAGGGGIADTGGSSSRTLVVLATPNQSESLAYAKAFAVVSVLIDGPDAGA